MALQVTYTTTTTIAKVDGAQSISRKSAQIFFTPKLAKLSKKEG